MTQGFTYFPLEEPFVSSHPKLLANDRNTITMNADTSFPENVLEGMLCYRTDQNKIYVYHKSKWEVCYDFANLPLLTKGGTLTGALKANGGITTTTLTTTGNTTVGGLLNVTGTGTIKAPSATDNSTSIVNSGWVWKLMQSYGLGAGLNTSPSISTALNDIDTTGFYTLSGEFTDAPSGLSIISAQLLHMERRFGAGTTGFQLLPHSNQIFYRTRNQDAWGGWSTVASQAWVQGQIDDLTTLTDDGVQVVRSPAYDALDDPGFYHCNSTGATSGPGYAAKMIVLGAKGATLQTQIAFPIYSTDSKCPAFRNRNNAGTEWTEWRKLALTNSRESLISGYYHSIISLDVTKGTTPSAVRWSTVNFQDTTGGNAEANRLGVVGHRYGNDGTVRMRLACYKPQAGSTEVAAIDVGYDASGAPFTLAPATPANANGTQIVTAGWANDKYMPFTGGAFTGNVYAPDSGFRIRSNSIEMGVTPSSNQFMYLPFYDKNGVDNVENRLACLQYAARTSGERDISFFMRNPADSNQAAGYYARWKADGTTRYWLGHLTPEDAKDNDVATASYVKKIGGSYWGLGNYAPRMSDREGWSTLVDVDKTGFYSVGSSNGQKVVGTVLHIQRQWEAGANGFQMNFGANNTICVRSRDTSYTAEWNEWVQLADRDWVKTQLSLYLPLSGGTVTGTLKAKAFQATSDARLKEEQKDVLYDLSALKPKHYRFKGEERYRVGLIAQDVQKIIPEAVTEDKNGYLGLDYNAVVAALVGEVNRLKIRLSQLENSA